MYTSVIKVSWYTCSEVFNGKLDDSMFSVTLHLYY